jgi:hypothetical protein
MSASAASENRDFEDTSANDGALKSVIQEKSHICSDDRNSLPMPAPKRSRVSISDILMSKIAQAILCNFSGFGQKCVKKNNRHRIVSLQQLVNLLNKDAEVVANCCNVELKVDTVKKWIDDQGPQYAEAGFEAAKKNAAQGGATVHGRPSKAQTDWMEVYNRSEKLSALVESVGKETKSGGKMMLKNSTASQAALEAASKACGTSQRETAICGVISRRDDDVSSAASSTLPLSMAGSSSSSASSQGSSAPYCNGTEDDSAETLAATEERRWIRPNAAAVKPGQKADKMDQLFTSIESVLALRQQTEAEEAQTKRIEAEAKRLEAEARSREAEAKLKEVETKSKKANANCRNSLLQQLERVTSIYQQVLEEGNQVRADKYRKIMDSLDDQLLAAMCE